MLNDLKEVYNYFALNKKVTLISPWVIMVYSLKSQIPQFAERFFLQSGLFEYFQNTIFAMCKFSASDLKFNYTV